MRLDPARTGEAVAAAAGDLVRIWRSARREQTPGPWPAALDGVLEPFLGALGAALATGGVPEQAWQETVGVVRLAPGQDAAARVEAEWRLLAEVLAAAADTLDAAPEAADFLARGVEAARHGAAALGAGQGPRSVVVLRLPRDGGRR